MSALALSRFAAQMCAAQAETRRRMLVAPMSLWRTDLGWDLCDQEPTYWFMGPPEWGWPRPDEPGPPATL